MIKCGDRKHSDKIGCYTNDETGPNKIYIKCGQRQEVKKDKGKNTFEINLIGWVFNMIHGITVEHGNYFGL